MRAPLTPDSTFLNESQTFNGFHIKMDGPQGDALMDTKFSKILQDISPAAVILSLEVPV